MRTHATNSRYENSDTKPRRVVEMHEALPTLAAALVSIVKLWRNGGNEVDDFLFASPGTAYTIASLEIKTTPGVRNLLPRNRNSEK